MDWSVEMALLRESQFIAGLGSYVLDVPTGRWKSSEGLDRLFGIPPEPYRSTENWLELVHPEDRVMMSDYLRNEVLGMGRDFDKEYRIIRPCDKREYWVHGRGTVVFDELDRPVELHGTIQDITGQKISQDRLIRIGSLYAALLKCSSAVVHCESEQELFEEICRSIVDLGTIKMAHISFFDADSDRITVKFRHGEGMEYLDGIQISSQPDTPLGRGPIGTSLREKHPVWCQDFQNDPLTKPWQEKARPFGWRCSASLPLFRKGEVMGVLSIYSKQVNAFDEETRNLLIKLAEETSFAIENYARRDEQKLLETQLRMLSQAVEQCPASVIITDRMGNIEYVNACFVETTGYTLAEVLGKNPRILKSDTTDPAQYRTLWEEITKGRQWRGDFHNRKKNGEYFWERALIAPIFSPEGEVINFLALKADITKEKEMQGKAESAAIAKSEFLAMISHELRTPLNGVIGFSQMLSETELNHEQEDEVRMIRECGEHLLKVVNDILEFSSIERKGGRIEAAPFDLSDLVQTACDTIRNAAEKKGLELQCRIAQGTPGKLSGDIRRTRQILINLLNNAIKFTEKGWVALKVSVIPSPTAQDSLEFSVADTGPGIPAEKLDRLFKPFSQVDSTLHREFEGTGLGLAISKRLAEAMGGSLTVISPPGRGCTFSLQLPLAPPDVGSCSTTKFDHCDADVAVFHPLEKPILVVEDDKMNRRLAEVMLKSIGVRVEFASNGLEAVEAIIPGKYAVIFMDMQMPVMDGLEATKKIRAKEAALRIPIIALTANVLPGDIERCLAAGMDDYISKPFKKKDFINKIAQFAAPADPQPSSAQK